MNVSDVLNKAADLIEERGWAQGAYENASGGLCVLGAIRKAADLDPPMIIAGVSLDAACAFNRHIGADNLVGDWNDAEGRTSGEVVAIFRAVAVIEAARESTPPMVMQPVDESGAA